MFLIVKRIHKASFYIFFLFSLILVFLSSCLHSNDHLQISAEALNKSTHEREKTSLSIGTNLFSITDWSTEMPFIDAFKSSRPWITQCLDNEPGCRGVWDTGEYEQIKLDKFGWVKSLPQPEDAPEYTRVSTLLFRDIVDYPEGKYVVLYEGEGNIEYQYDAQKIVAESTPGRDVIIVNPSPRGIYLSITATDPNNNGNYLRNIHLVPENQEKTYQDQIFNQQFLDKLGNFSTLRFMDWMGTNDSQQSRWQNRPQQETYSYHHKLGGVPIETMLKLANYVDANPWFNIPHQATDEYIRNFAWLVKSILKPDLKVYVEYSNEVWNNIFPQGKWIEKQGLEEWQNNSESNYAKRMNWYGKRTAQICDIWKKEFGDQSERVICTLGSQAANEWTANQALDCQLWSQGSCQEHGIDTLAIAPYFGSYIGKKKYEQEVQNWTVDQLFIELNQGGVLSESPRGGAIKKAIDNMRNNWQVAQSRNLQLITYEGGQHLVGNGGVENNSVINDLFIAANRDWRMYDTYLSYLNQLQQVGGKLFMNWLDIGAYSKWGSWGALEHLNQESAPKYDALIDFINNNNG